MKFNIPRSTFFSSFEWTGERTHYPEPGIKGDTYPITWGDDDELYTSSGDPSGDDKVDGLAFERFSGMPPDYKIARLNTMPEYRGFGGWGEKPSGMICVNGTLYLAFQNMLKGQIPPQSLRSQHGSDAHIVYSFCKGWMWSPTRTNISAPMFPGYKFGGPSFVQHGKNNDTAKDNFVYAVSSDQWDNGSNLRLGRVPQDEIIRPESWRWVGAWNIDGSPAWTHKLEDSIPILSLHRWMGLPEMVYLPKFDRYLFLTWRLHEDFSPTAGTDLLILDAPNPWGPFSLVHFEEYWETQHVNPYCPRIPLKWLSEDNATGWVLFSGSWGSVPQDPTLYRANVRPFKLTR